MVTRENIKDIAVLPTITLMSASGIAIQSQSIGIQQFRSVKVGSVVNYAACSCFALRIRSNGQDYT